MIILAPEGQKIVRSQAVGGIFVSMELILSVFPENTVNIIQVKYIIEGPFCREPVCFAKNKSFLPRFSGNHLNI